MNWSVYNDFLVRRGEILLDFSVLEDWDKEVRQMSDGRRGGDLSHTHTQTP